MIPHLALLTTVAPPLPTAYSGLNPRSSTTMRASAASLETIFKEKKALRSRVKKALKSMDPTLRSQENDAIQSIVLEAPWFKSCTRLCAYISCAALREVDTSKLLSEILKNSAQDDDMHVRKKLYVPRVEGKNSFMRMLNISRMDDLIANSMDILEPAPCDAEGNVKMSCLQMNLLTYLFYLGLLSTNLVGAWAAVEVTRTPSSRNIKSLLRSASGRNLYSFPFRTRCKYWKTVLYPSL